MNEVPVACGCSAQASEAELMERLDGVLAEYRDRPGALIPVLQIAQGIFGYLPEKVLKRIALSMGKSYSEVAGVVGFYAFFSTHPRGRHVIRVCLGTACYVRGGKQVLEAMRKELGVEVGGTTEDGMFSLEIARCFGACGLAPAVSIDEEVYKRVRPARIREILVRYREPETEVKAMKAADSGNGKRKAADGVNGKRKTADSGNGKKKASRKATARRGVKVHG